MNPQYTGLTRREFLLATVSALIAGCSDAGRDATTAAGADANLLKDALLNLVGDRDAAARIGRDYLDRHPEYKTGDDLLNDIQRTLVKQDASAAESLDSERVASAIKQAVTGEYTQGEVESVAGWILSRTEARLYALHLI